MDRGGYEHSPSGGGMGCSGIWKLMTLGLLAPAPCLAAQGDPPTEEREPYVDRLIAGGSLTPLTSQDKTASTDTSGPVRSIDIEVGGSIISPRSSISGIDTSALDRTMREAGVSVSGRYQSTNFGLLGIDAQLQRGSSGGAIALNDKAGWSGSAALTTRDLPLGQGWVVDGAIGTSSISPIALVRRQTRFYLPSTPILGASATFKRYSQVSQANTPYDLQPTFSFNLAVGEPGLLGGLRLSDFTGLSGRSLTAGAQIELTSKWSAGIQAVAVDDSRDPYSAIITGNASGAAGARISAQGALGTVAYNGGAIRIQANAIWSHNKSTGAASALGPHEGASGAWIDGTLRSGKSFHSAGAYVFGPGLSWGTSSLINNAYGGYYRFTRSSQRWRWTFSVDAIGSVDGQTASGLVANADIRRKVGFETSLGVNTSLRRTNGQSASQILGFLEFQSPFGPARTELGWSHDPATDAFRLGINQNWDLPGWLPSGSRLSTQASYEHRRQTGASPYFAGGTQREKANGFGLAISGGATPINGLSLDATLSYNSNGNASTTEVYGPVDLSGFTTAERGRAFSASIVATARISPRLSLSASYTDTTSRLTSLFGLGNAGIAVPSLPANSGFDTRRSAFHLRAAYLTLRFAASAGRPTGSLGLRQFPVGGTGNLQGRVYLDANDNQSREPSEAGVGGIVVILDGIQAVRTDPSGYYRFEGVADGPHRITLNADMLPLPWVIENDDKRQSGDPYLRVVKVGVRSTTVLDIPASKN